MEEKVRKGQGNVFGSLVIYLDEGPVNVVYVDGLVTTGRRDDWVNGRKDLRKTGEVGYQSWRSVLQPREKKNSY